MNKLNQAYLASHQTGGRDWPAQASFAAKYRMSTWPCGWSKEADVTFFESLQELAVWLAHKAEWAKCEDNRTAIEVFEWNLGPNIRLDLSVNPVHSGNTYEELEQRRAAQTQAAPKVLKKKPTMPKHNATFNRLVDKAEHVMFDPLWIDRAGNLSNAVDAEYSPRLERGAMVVSQDHLGRAILIIGIGFGAKVVVREVTRNPLNTILLCDALPAFIEEVRQETRVFIDEVVPDKGMQAICETIAVSLTSAHEDKLRALLPWSKF